MVKCLFIGDEENDLKIFKRALGDVFPGAYCYTSENGVEAVEIMDDYDLIPDFVFLELDKTGCEAIEFLCKIREMGAMKGVPVIVHAAEPHPDKVEMLRECGALAIYFKPYEYTGVCNVLNLYIGGEYASYQLN